MISDGKSIEVRVDEDGGSDRGRDGIRWGKSDAVNQQRGNFDACATRRHSLQKRWMQELGKPSRITDGKPVAFSQDHLSHFCDRCFDLVGDRLHIPRPVPNLVKNSTSRVQLFECIENASRNLDDLCSPVSKGTCLLYEAGKDATRIKKNEFRNLREDWEELQKKKKPEILSENDSVDVFGRCSMPFRWISTSLNKTISNSMLEIRECCFVECEIWKKKITYIVLWTENFLEILTESLNLGRICVMLSSICTVAPTLIGPTTMKFPVSKDLKQEKVEDIFPRYVQKAPRNDKIITRMVPVMFVHKNWILLSRENFFLTKKSRFLLH